VTGDRRTILLDVPLTAVAAARATEAERVSACSTAEAHDKLTYLCQEASSGDRGALVDIHALVFHHDDPGVRKTSTRWLADRVLEAVREGRLLLVRGWPSIAGYASSVVRVDSTTTEGRLARRIMAHEQHLAFEGQSYLVLPASSWAEVRESGQYEVVRREQAAPILRGLAAHHSADRRAALEEATGQLAHTHAPGVREGLFVARRVTRTGGGGAPGHAAAPAVTPSRVAQAHAAPKAAPGPAMGHLIVRVRTPLGAAISGVTVEVPGLPHLVTGGDGRADFGAVAPAGYNVRAHKAGYGPVPAGAGVFAIGDATGVQVVPAGPPVTLDLQMVTVTSVRVSHTPVVAATPLRIYKHAAGDVHVDHVITCTALCPRAAGAGPGTQIPVRVDWTFTPAGSNAPKAKGGKDNTDVHFGAAPGFAVAGPGTTTASTTTNDAGETQVTFRASVTSGDRFTVHAKVLRDPANPGAGDLGHADSPDFEVWKRLDYNNLYRMQSGGNAGFDLAPRCTPANIQPAFTPTFTEYTVGAPHIIAYREYITNLVVPTAAQLPLNGTVRVRSDGPDVRTVTIHGLVVAADGSTSPGVEALVLTGPANVVGARNFQKITSVTVAPPSPARTVTIETGAGAAVGTIAPHHPATAPNFLFDTVAAVQAKAQAWYDANDAQLGVDMAALNAAIGAAGYFMVGAGYYHPKMDGRPATGQTSYYAGYPTIRLTYYTHHFHPDGNWIGVDGVNQDKMSCLFLNVGGGAYASMVARHEIGHASDHVSYGPGDHCPQNTCLMFESSQQNQFCTIGADHSVRRTQGWSP
jgi:hypothetical protein